MPGCDAPRAHRTFRRHEDGSGSAIVCEGSLGRAALPPSQSVAISIEVRSVERAVFRCSPQAWRACCRSPVCKAAI